MKAPPFLISASILLWGWQTRMIYPALGMVAVLEGSRLYKTRWEFSESDIARIADLCTIMLAMALLIALNIDTRRFLIVLVQWLPLVIFPLIAAQQYSRLGMIHGRALLVLLRRRLGKRIRGQFLFDISYPYWGLCMISAASVKGGRDWFYGGLIALVVWALWPARSRRYSRYLWVALILASGALGYAGQFGLTQLQSYFMKMAYRHYLKHGDDPFKSITAIGDVGALKPSNRILFRVTTEDRRPEPLLLRQACYTIFSDSAWYATYSGFNEIFSDGDGLTWNITPATGKARKLSIATYLPKGKYLFKVPGGTFRLDNLNIFMLEKNSLGALRTTNEEGDYADFQVLYDPSQSFNRPAGDADLKIPTSEAAAVQTIARTLELSSKSPVDAIAAIRTFFLQHFRYSLDLTGNASPKRDLSDFLLNSRAGHCEYFATATVLLLRAAGIPARYVTGYSAGEYSDLENCIIVRQRHAHAWAIADVAGKWVDIDTTPPDWSALESSQVSRLTLISDFFAFLRFRFAMWRQQLKMQKMTFYLIIPLVVLLVILVKRLAGQKRMKRIIMGKRTETLPEKFSDRTSEFYAIEKWLNQLGHERQPGETFQGWFERLSSSAPEIIPLPEIQPILRLHYRQRFGRGELNQEDLGRLAKGVRALLNRT